MVLLFSVLRKIKTGYIADIVKIKNFLFMDGKEINILTMSKVQAISQDTGIEFGIKNSGMLIKGNLIKNRGIKLNDEEVIKEIVEEFNLLKLKKSNSKK